jgi:hypothetical protein
LDQADDVSIQEYTEGDRLIFSSIQEFQELMGEIDPETLKGNTPKLLQKKAKFPSFISLAEMESDDLLELGANYRISNTDSDMVLDSISNLVPDITLRHFLNDKLEIEIEDYVYKVAPYGTFYTHKSSYDKLDDVISRFGEDHDSNFRVEGSIVNIEGGEDVYFIDTFGEDLGLQSTTNAALVDNKIYQANDFLGVAPYLYALPKSDYDSFVTYNYGAKTVIGKLIQGIAGGNTSFEQNYTSKYRFWVKLYDFNYGFYRSVGLHSKMQKKGWTGIWAMQSEVKAEKMVLGWDGLLLDLKIPYVMPIGYSGFPSKGVSEEILNFTSFSLPTGNITDVRVPFLGVQSFSYNDLEKMLKKVLKVTYASLTKEIWKEAESSLASASLEVKQSNVKSYRKVFPDEVKLALTRHEITANNVNELSFVIDRYYGITYKATGTGNFSSFSKNVMEPTLSSVKKMYEIDGASVYGASVFLGQMKGIRIIKEINE